MPPFVVYGASFVTTGIEEVYSEDGNSLTLTYETYGGAGSIPALGSGTSRMAGVILKRATVTPGEGDVSTVKLEYGPPDDDEDEGEGGEDEGEGGEGDDEGEGEIVSWDFDGSVCDVPILAHPKAQADITDDQREYLKAVIDGTRLWEKVAEVKPDGEPKLDKDGEQVMKPLKKLLKDSLSANGQAVLKLILSGIKSYRSPCGTFRVTKRVSNNQVSLSGLGKIAQPNNAPSVSGGRNWLLVGASFHRTAEASSSSSSNLGGSLEGNFSSSKKWDVEYQYELSDEGGWNPQVYGS